MIPRREILLLAFAVLAALAAAFLPWRTDGLSLHLVHVAGTADAQTIERLIDSGADVDARNSMGMTPLHWAAYRGRISVIQTLLDRGADPGAVNHDGHTPAMVAAARGRDRHRQILERAVRRRDSRTDAGTQ